MEKYTGAIALIISAVGLSYTIWNARNTARKDYVKGLEHRVEKLETDLVKVTSERDELTRKNFQLMQELLAKNQTA